MGCLSVSWTGSFVRAKGELNRAKYRASAQDLRLGQRLTYQQDNRNNYVNVMSGLAINLT